MAGGVMLVQRDDGKTYTGKLTGYVVFVCIVAGSGGLLFGYDIGVTGGVTSMPAFQDKFFPDVAKHVATAGNEHYCKYDNQILQLFTSSLFMAAMLSALVAGVISHRQGRNRTMLYAGCCFLVGAGLTGGATHVAMLVVGRIHAGVSGWALPTRPFRSICQRWHPAHLRGALNIMFQFATVIGILVAQLVNFGTHQWHDFGWRISLALAGLPAIVLTLGGLTLPDTPNSLVERGFRKEAREVLERIRGLSDVEAEYSDIVGAAEANADVKSPFMDIFKRQYRPDLTMAVLMPLFQQFTGINAIMFYAPVLFNSLGSSESLALLQTVIVGVVNVLATIVAIVFVDRWGRKVLFLQGGIQMALSEITMGIVLGIFFSDPNRPMTAAMAIGVIVVVCVYTSGFAWSWGPLGWLVPSETQALEVRASGMAISVCVNFLFTFIVGQAFLSMMCSMKFGIFLFFAGWVIIMTLFTIFFLPETKGVPMEEMQLMWGRHWFWKRFVTDRPQPVSPSKAISGP
eukprot:jgi/Botrbrau1/5150/Bobra.0172s0022.1